MLFIGMIFFFFFKQKTANEVLISDWSSDVCSSDLTYTVTFTSATDYTVDVSDSAGNAVYSYAGAGYVAGSSKSIALQGGVQVEMSGQPATGDTFTIEPASAPAYTAVPTAATGLAIDRMSTRLNSSH